jgi:hypothetical protein
MPAVAAAEREPAVRADAVPVQPIARRRADEPAMPGRAATKPANLRAEPDFASVRAPKPAAVRSEPTIDAAVRSAVAAGVVADGRGDAADIANGDRDGGAD